MHLKTLLIRCFLAFQHTRILIIIHFIEIICTKTLLKKPLQFVNGFTVKHVYVPLTVIYLTLPCMNYENLSDIFPESFY